MTKQRTIIRKSIFLRKHPWIHIDQSSIDLLWQNIPVSSPKSDNRNSLISLLDCYLGLTNQSITYLSLSNVRINTLFAGFIGALLCNSFWKASKITKAQYRLGFTKALRAMADSIPSLAFEFDSAESLRAWNKLEVDPLQREYYEGWSVTGKSGRPTRGLTLAWIWRTLGHESARSLHKTVQAFVERYEGTSSNNFVPIFNQLMEYLERTFPNLDEVKLRDPAFTIELIDGFCRDFFTRCVNSKNCLQTTIKRWNDAVPTLESVFHNSGVFSKTGRAIPYIEPSRKIGAEHKISTTKEGLIIKENLIVDVPLEITDDEVINLLFKKINGDVEAVLAWATSEVSSIIARCRMNGPAFNYMDFGLTSSELVCKYRTIKRKDARLRDIAEKFGLPTSYSLEPFIYLLIKEHPEITTAFLLDLRLFDKSGVIVGLESTDSCTYLVGQKRRRGAKNAIQKVLLNEKSIELAFQLIELTKPLRGYLREKGDDNYRYFFLFCRTGFVYPSPIRTILNPKKRSYSFSNRIKKFRECSPKMDDKNLERLLQCLTPSRFRATVGVQVFLKSGSAKTMSKALGHARYKPELLSHYLPEPILAFFQARWIRVFQKGIVCEAMKDSPLRLRASHFKSIDELDKFLNNHALKLPEDPGESNRKVDSNILETYISIDESILALLMSIEAAVKEIGEETASAKSVYWARFSTLLQSEIESMTYDPELIHVLEVARENVDSGLMKMVVLDSRQQIA